MLVTMGEALVDLVPEPIVGGAPLNVAVAAARLGTPTAFLGRTSTDEYGSMIRHALERAGVDMRLVETGPEPTLRAVVDHGPPVSYAFEGADTADEFIGSTDLARLGGGDHLLHACGLGLFRGIASDRFLALARTHDGIVSVDPNPRPLAIADRAAWRHRLDEWLAAADVFRATEEDLAYIDPGRDPESFMAERRDAGTVVTVIGRDDGTNLLRTATAEATIPLVPATVVDTVGAGDTFVGAFLHAILDETERTSLREIDGASWERIGCFAAAAASITCSRAGADPPTADEVETRLAAFSRS